MKKEYDAFICHAKADKTVIVDSLVDLLVNEGLKVWYDRYIEPGKNFSLEINEAMAKSDYGILIFSPNFINSEWAKEELGSMLNLEVKSKIKVIPVLHNITHDFLESNFPLLGGKKSISTKEGLPIVIHDILFALGRRKEIKPDFIIKKEKIKVSDLSNFFTDKFFVITQADGLPGVETGITGLVNLKYQDSPVTPILPFHPEIIKYLNWEKVDHQIHLENTSSGIQVCLKLTLAQEEQEKEYIREYRNSEIERLDNLPILEVWPNFSTPTWRSYYIYYDSLGRPNTFYAKPVTTGQIKKSSFKNVRGELEREIICLSNFPKAFECEAKSGGNTVNAGIILVKPANTPPAAIQSWDVGIHFSSKMTSVFIKEKEKEPYPLNLLERLMQITAPGAVRANLYKYFIQDAPEKTGPIPNIYHCFQNQSGIKSRIEPILDGHIFLLPFIDNFKSGTPGIATDLEWVSTKEKRLQAQAFLAQLCLQLSVEAVWNGVRKICWHLSYPNIYSIKDRSDFQNLWQQISKDLMEQTGIIQAEKHSHYINENIAAAYFFANHPECMAKLNRGAVCVLIGDKTSEVSIWQGADIQLRRQTSVYYAIQDILLELLRHKPNLFDTFGIGGPETDYLKMVKNVPKSFYMQADFLIHKKETEILKLLPILSGDPMVREFINLMILGLAGLFHYIGLILMDLREKGQYQRKIPDIYIGGKGSRLFYWVSTSQFGPDHPICILFKKILAQASGFEAEVNKFEFYLSPCPDAEIAYGLVASDSFEINYGDCETNWIIAGEEFTKESGKFPWNTALSNDIISTDIQTSPRLQQFSTFLDNYNRYITKVGMMPVKYEPQDFIDICDDLNCKLAQCRNINQRSGENAANIEPLFISALKCFIDMKADQWVKKYY
jgi:hypothetical protein